MEKDLQKRMRFTPLGMAVRESKEGEEESRTIEGKAIVFNEETVLWDGKYERVREIISPTCITKEFLAEQDIKLNLLHNRADTIARCNKGEGTLNLDLREDGLYFSVELPKCDLGDRALELIRNKTYTGCSFEFFTKDYIENTTTMADGREDILITHTSFAQLDALTIAMDPAYAQTSVNEREQFEKREADETNRRETEGTRKREADRLAALETRDRMLADLQREIDAERAILDR